MQTSDGQLYEIIAKDRNKCLPLRRAWANRKSNKLLSISASWERDAKHFTHLRSRCRAQLGALREEGVTEDIGFVGPKPLSRINRVVNAPNKSGRFPPTYTTPYGGPSENKAESQPRSFAHARCRSRLTEWLTRWRRRDRSLNLCGMRPGNCQQDRALFERLQVVLERAIEHEQMTVRQINCLLGQL